jgi:signal transduction histidine kinase
VADSPLHRFAQEVVRNTVRLQRLVVQLRDLSDLGPEEVEVGQQPLPVDGLLNGLAGEWRPAATASGLTLAVDIADSEMYVLGDERRLRWALGNLLDNALKYGLPDGVITLSARRVDSSSAEIAVQDTGVGVQPRDLPHVFTRFYRGSPYKPDGTLLRVPGMGQGLFISQRVIEAHGGAIRLDSQPGRGTRVVCNLPLTAPVTMSLETAAAALQPAPIARATDLTQQGEAASLVRRATPPGRTTPRQ